MRRNRGVIIINILVSIDDTDNLESKGTGELAEMISNHIEEMNWGRCFKVTRHQLLVHPDIPYTSHNSSMCFSAEVDERYIDSIIGYACDFLSGESAPESDPGLCVALIDKISDPDVLMDFGRKAKREILTKDYAYETAKLLGVHLSEHGGTGQGIIGALAGAGLRLTGNDGRFKGGYKNETGRGVLKASEIMSIFGIDEVRSMDKSPVHPDDLVKLDEKIKTVLLDGKSVLLVYASDEDNANWKCCSKQYLKRY